MARHSTCPHCHAPTNELPHRFLRGFLLSMAWIGAMAIVFCSIMLGPGIIIVLPWAVFGGMALVTAGHEYAFGDRLCNACHRVVVQDGVEIERGAIVPEAEIVQRELLAGAG